MISWKVILATMVIFGAGVLTGGLLVNSIGHDRHDHGRFPLEGRNPHPQTGAPGPSRPGDLSRPRSPEIWRKDLLEHLNEELKLTPEQRATISKIVAEGQERNREIWTNVVPKMRQEMERVHQRIRAELTPEQQKRFEDLVRQFAPHGPAHAKTPPSSSTNNVPTPPAGAPGT